MLGERTRKIGAIVGRYAVVYPGLATGGAYAASRVSALPFDTVLFVVFAVAVVVTGVGATSGSSSTDVLQYGGFGGTSNPGERWEAAPLVKLVLFDLGVAVVLTVHAFWPSGGW